MEVLRQAAPKRQAVVDAVVKQTVAGIMAVPDETVSAVVAEAASDALEAFGPDAMAKAIAQRTPAPCSCVCVCVVEAAATRKRNVGDETIRFRLEFLNREVKRPFCVETRNNFSEIHVLFSSLHFQ